MPDSAPSPDAGPRTLITGGTGFIGSNLAEHLSRCGREVMVLGRAARTSMPQCRFTKCDVLDLETLQDVCGTFQPRDIVHLAASSHFAIRDDEHGYRTNTEGTRNVLHVATETPSVERCLFASSNVVTFSDQGGDNSLRYADSKRELERLVQQHPGAGRVLVVFRPCAVWGPRLGPPFLGFFLAIAAGRYRHLGRLDPPKRLGYVGNVVFQIGKLLEAPPGQVHQCTFDLADDEVTTIRAWANLIAKTMGRPAPRVLPESAVKTAALAGDLLRSIGVRNPPLSSFRLGNMRRDTSTVPLEAIQAITGPLPCTLADGVKETVSWLRVTGQIR